jgi:hypothetical protein
MTQMSADAAHDEDDAFVEALCFSDEKRWAKLRIGIKA